MGKKSKVKNVRKDSLVGALSPLICQALQPKEIRFEPPRQPSLQDIKALQDAFASRIHGVKGKPTAAQGLFPPEVWLPFLANLGTGLWRLKQRMLDPSTGQPIEEMRRVYKHLDSVWDLLSDVGVQIRDHQGELLPAKGFSGLNVLAYQPIPGLKKERVIETVRPTVSVRPSGANQDVLVQRGEVIVGIPEEQAGNPLKSEPA